MGSELVAFQHEGPNDFGYHNPNAGRLGDGISAGYPIVGYKGGKWTIKYNGTTHLITRADDGTPAAALNVIIIEAAPHKSKTFYKQWVDGSTEPPDCASFDGVTPDAGVKAQQAQTCALCSRNKLILNPQTGKKMTECRDHKRLAIYLLPADTKRILGETLETVAFLRVPAASLAALRDMGDQTERMGLPFYTYVTQITFVPEESYPKMVFKAVKKLTSKEAPMIKKLIEDPVTARIIKGGDTQPALGAPVRQSAVAFASGGNGGTEEIETGIVGHDFGSPSRPNKAEPALLELQANPVSAKVPEKPVQAPADELDLGGFAPVPASPAPAPAQAAPAANVVSDTGPVTEADAEIDAAIAALMPA